MCRKRKLPRKKGPASACALPRAPAPVSASQASALHRSPRKAVSVGRYLPSPPQKFRQASPGLTSLASVRIFADFVLSILNGGQGDRGEQLFNTLLKNFEAQAFLRLIAWLKKTRWHIFG
jgi:hypothetical protein